MGNDKEMQLAGA